MHNKRDPYDDAELLERLFYDKGLSREEIADKYDVTYRTVNRWLKKHDLQPKTRSLKFGRMDTITRGYEAFIDYTGPGQNERVYIHRLLAVAMCGFDEVSDTHVHHESGVPWDNRPDNIRLMDASEHISHHSQQRSDELSELWSEMWEDGTLGGEDWPPNA